MRLAFSLAACVFACCLPPTASGEVYQWKDGSGRTVISDMPPPANAKAARTLAEGPAAGEAAKALAEKETAFRKRRQEAREKSEKETREAATAAERQESCERARGYLATLEAGEPLLVRGEQGDKHYLDNAGRQQEMERARKAMAASCK